MFGADIPRSRLGGLSSLLNPVGVVMLRDRGDTSNAVTFTLALAAMWAERVSHKVLPRPLPYCLWVNSSPTGD